MSDSYSTMKYLSLYHSWQFTNHQKPPSHPAMPPCPTHMSFVSIRRSSIPPSRSSASSHGSWSSRGIPWWNRDHGGWKKGGFTSKNGAGNAGWSMLKQHKRWWKTREWLILLSFMSVFSLQRWFSPQQRMSWARLVMIFSNENGSQRFVMSD